MRALVFHPNGQHLLSASDDKTIRIWDLVSGRCAKTVDAHSHFVTCMSWGRQMAKVADPKANGATANGNTESANLKPINVVATGSVDQTVKIWMP